MTAVRILLWKNTASVLVEDAPHRFKRLTGGPFGEDGTMPLVAAILGTECHIGYAALSVAYEYPRTVLTSLDGAPAERVATFLSALDEAVRARLFHDTLSYDIHVDETHADGRLNSVCLACWMAGLEYAKVVPLRELCIAGGMATTIAEGKAALCGTLRAGIPWAGLAIRKAEMLTVVDGSTAPDPTGDPMCELSETSAGLARSWFHADGARLAALTCGKEAPLAAAIPSAAGWTVQSLPQTDTLDRERRYWNGLAQLCHSYREQVRECELEKLLLIESGQRCFKGRVGALARPMLERSVGLPVESVPLESLEFSSRGLDDPPANALAINILGKDDVIERRIAATLQPNALPYEVERSFPLNTVNQGRVRLSLNALDPNSPKTRDCATIEINVPPEVGRNSLARLRVRLLPCRIRELVFEIPEYHFREVIALDTASQPAPDAGKLTRESRRPSGV
jgi:hypothetical protein